MDKKTKKRYFEIQKETFEKETKLVIMSHVISGINDQLQKFQEQNKKVIAIEVDRRIFAEIPKSLTLVVYEDNVMGKLGDLFGIPLYININNIIHDNLVTKSIRHGYNAKIKYKVAETKSVVSWE